MKCNKFAVLAFSVLWMISSVSWAVPPVNDVCDTGAIVIDQATCAPSTDIGNCAKNKSAWCSPLFVECANGDGLCVPILDDNNVASSNQFDCDIVPTDNREATTDGQAMEDFSTCSGSFFGSDVWWKVVAPCQGLMSVSMCGGGSYDAMMAAYDGCPQGPFAPTVVACNDDGCVTTSDISELTPFPVVNGQEVTIRVGGWAGTPGSPVPAAQGQSEIHVRFACIAVESAPVAALTGEPGFDKNRYVSFDPTTNGTDAVAIRVKRLGGIDKFVDCTQVVNKGADGFYAKLINGPLPPPGDFTYYCDWSGVTTGLHVTACNVLPGNAYQIATTIDGNNFSPSLEIVTTPPGIATGRHMGDIVGQLVGGAWTAPDGVFTAFDLSAMISAASMDPTAPLLARADLVGESQIGGVLLVPDAIVSSADINQYSAAFSGQVFGFGVTNCLTGTCLPPADCTTVVVPGAPIAPAPLNAEAAFSKDRYVSINPTTNGIVQVAIRVMRVGGTAKYLDCTSLVDRGPDGWYAELIDGPLPVTGDATYYCDLSGIVTGLHMRGCSVLPGNMYDISTTIDGTEFSSALAIPTTAPQISASRQYGDLVGVFIGNQWLSPDNFVTANDIVAVVSKFKIDPTAPLLARMDTDGMVPNGILTGGDVLRAVTGFAGGEFGFGVTDCLTGTCVPPVGSCE